MTNYSTGHNAEELAADYLRKEKYKIIELNWKTKYCEIDIVAVKNNTAYLVEVKSRKSTNQGIGFEYITTKKLKQMRFAAEMWIVNNAWNGDYQLAAISITANKFEFITVDY